MKKVIIYFLMIMLVCSFASAETISYDFSENTCIDFTCTNLTAFGSYVSLNYTPTSVQSDRIVWQVPFGSNGFYDVANNDNGTITGASWYERRGVYLKATPTDSSHDIDYSSPPQFGTNNATICSWIRNDGSDGTFEMLGFTTQKWALGSFSNNWKINGGGGCGATFSTDDNTDGTWAFVCGTYNHSLQALYVNGDFSTSESCSSDIGVFTDVEIGSSGAQVWNFSFSGITTWNYSLSGAEIQSLYNEGRVSFVTGSVILNNTFSSNVNLINISFNEEDNINSTTCFKVLNETGTPTRCTNTTDISLTESMDNIYIEWIINSTDKRATSLINDIVIYGEVGTPSITNISITSFTLSPNPIVQNNTVSTIITIDNGTFTLDKVWLTINGTISNVTNATDGINIINFSAIQNVGTIPIIAYINNTNGTTINSSAINLVINPAPTPTNYSNFTIIMIPDTQDTVQGGANDQAILKAQSEWIVNSTINGSNNLYNIFFTVHVGDLVNTWNSTSEWININSSYERFNNNITYSITPGNHDDGPSGIANNISFYDRYFPRTKFEQYEEFRDTLTPDMRWSWYNFTVLGTNYAVINTYYNHSPEGLNWTQEIIENNTDKYIIINSHSVINCDTTFTTDGQNLYDAIKTYSNVAFVMSGHVIGCNSSYVNQTFNGNTISFIESNYQGLGSYGGDGWMKVITIEPSTKEVLVESYSPFLNEFGLDENQTYSFTITATLPQEAAYTSIVLSDSTLQQNQTLTITSIINNGTETLDKIWFTLNDTVLNTTTAVNGTNIINWPATYGAGTYNITGHVNVSTGKIYNSTVETFTITIPTPVNISLTGFSVSPNPVNQNSTVTISATLANGSYTLDKFWIEINGTQFNLSNATVGLNSINVDTTGYSLGFYNITAHANSTVGYQVNASQTLLLIRETPVAAATDTFSSCSQTTAAVLTLTQFLGILVIAFIAGIIIVGLRKEIALETIQPFIVALLILLFVIVIAILIINQSCAILL